MASLEKESQNSNRNNFRTNLLIFSVRLFKGVLPNALIAHRVDRVMIGWFALLHRIWKILSKETGYEAIMVFTELG
jgi:hypothetical protein